MGIQESDYFPLRGSSTFASKPSGISPTEERTLAERQLIFLEPDSKLILSTGMARYWPAARGVWAAKDGTVAAWINQEDHVRLISKAKGADLRTAFLQLIRLEQMLNKVLQ